MEAQPDNDVLEKVTGLGFAFQYKGKTYRLSPMQVQDFAELKSWLKEKIAEDAKETGELLGSKGAPEDVIRDLWAEAIKQIGNPLASPIFRSPEGLMKLIETGLRHHHPEVDEALVKEMMQDPETSKDVLEKTRKLNKLNMDVAGN